MFTVLLVLSRRRDFIQAGTLAKGAPESGQVEAYICSKIKRNPLASRPCAEYLGYFLVGELSCAEYVGYFPMGELC